MEVWYTSAVLARCTLTTGKTVITARENVGRLAKGIKGHMGGKKGEFGKQELGENWRSHARPPLQ